MTAKLPYAEDVENVPDVEWQDQDGIDMPPVIDGDEEVEFETALIDIPYHAEDSYVEIPHPEADDPDSMKAPTLGFDEAVPK